MKKLLYASFAVSTTAVAGLSLYTLYKVIKPLAQRRLARNAESKHRQKKPHRTHKAAHGPQLPLIYAPEPPYSEEAHHIYNVCLKMGEDTLKSVGNVHHNTLCVFCQRTGPDIHGIRYVCAQCGLIDMCEQCERENMHEPSHLLYKLPFHVPPQLASLSVYRNQIPWQTEDNLDFLGSNYVPSALGFDKIEELKSVNRGNMSSAEIEALYDQFCCLADMSYEDYLGLEHESSEESTPAVSKSALSQVLATRYSIDTYLRDFLCNLYDDDKNGVITFEDYVYGMNLIISTDNYNEKVQTIVDACPPNVEMKTHLRNLILAFVDLTKNAFADALNIQAFVSHPEEQVLIDNEASAFQDEHKKSRRQDFVELEQDNLLWERRQEINTWADYDPLTKTNPQVDSELNILWDLAIEDNLNELFDKLHASYPPEDEYNGLIDIILSEQKFLNLTTACLEAGII